MTSAEQSVSLAANKQVKRTLSDLMTSSSSPVASPTNPRMPVSVMTSIRPGSTLEAKPFDGLLMLAKTDTFSEEVRKQILDSNELSRKSTVLSGNSGSSGLMDDPTRLASAEIAESLLELKHGRHTLSRQTTATSTTVQSLGPLSRQSTTWSNPVGPPKRRRGRPAKKRLNTIEATQPQFQTGLPSQDVKAKVREFVQQRSAMTPTVSGSPPQMQIQALSISTGSPPAPSLPNMVRFGQPIMFKTPHVGPIPIAPMPNMNVTQEAPRPVVTGPRPKSRRNRPNATAKPPMQPDLKPTATKLSPSAMTAEEILQLPPPKPKDGGSSAVDEPLPSVRELIEPKQDESNAGHNGSKVISKPEVATFVGRDHVIRSFVFCCGRKFLQGEEYDLHSQFEHVLICRHCKKQFIDRRSINKHQLTYDSRPCAGFRKLK